MKNNFYKFVVVMPRHGYAGGGSLLPAPKGV